MNELGAYAIFVIIVANIMPYPHFYWENARYEGVVTDIAGHPIPDVVIAINQGIKVNNKVTVRTDDNGHYIFIPETKFSLLIGGYAIPRCTDNLTFMKQGYDDYSEYINHGRHGHSICKDVSIMKNIILYEKKK